MTTMFLYHHHRSLLYGDDHLLPTLTDATNLPAPALIRSSPSSPISTHRSLSSSPPPSIIRRQILSLSSHLSLHHRRFSMLFLSFSHFTIVATPSLASRDQHRLFFLSSPPRSSAAAIIQNSAPPLFSNAAASFSFLSSPSSFLDLFRSLFLRLSHPHRYHDSPLSALSAVVPPDSISICYLLFANPDSNVILSPSSFCSTMLPLARSSFADHRQRRRSAQSSI